MRHRLNKAITLGTLSGLLSTLVASLYILFYFNQIVDFSEGKGIFSWIPELISINMLIAFGISFIQMILIDNTVRVNKKRWYAFFFAVLVFIISFGLVFYVLMMNDPIFSTEEAQLMSVFFKGFLMPLAFIPALSWYTIQSIYLK